ncbi:MAG: 2-keto-4-pentenoate hydratase [Litorimonas sp.]
MSSITDISATFITARREGRALHAYPGEVPTSLEAAYAIQAKSIANWGEPVVGYKVGGIGPDWHTRYPSDWLVGPVFPSHIIHVNDTGPVDVPVFRGGFAAYEPELVFRLSGLSIPRGVIKTTETAKRFIRSVYIGAEIASSPLAILNDLGPGSIISDFGNQSSVVVGPEIGIDWLDRLNDIEVTTTIDAAMIGVKTVNPGADGPFGALRFLLNHLRNKPEFNHSDTAWLSSGAITGVHRAEINSSCSLTYKDLGVINLRMVEKKESAV